MTIYTDPEENEDYGFVFPPHGHRPPEIRYPRPRHRHRHHHPLVSTPLGMGPRGPQGETFTFDDLTDEQLAELREDVASVYHRKLESVYTTTGESTSQIPIPWESYDSEKDMLFVRIEGLWLHANEYTVSEGNIVLTTPITHAGTAVGITMITTVAMSVEDLENLHGEDGFSPTVSMTRQNNGTLLSITDADGTTSALIPDGAIGPTGQTGPVGPAGPQGPKGDKGDKGDVGPVGPKGQKGDKGDKGDAGLQGPKGDTGDQGPQGVTGLVGPQGEQGPQGIAGNDGTSPLAIDVGTDSIIVHCDSEGKTAKAETTGFNVYAHVGTVTHAVSLTVTCPPHGIPSWLNVYVGSYSVNVSWQEGVAAEDALLVLTVSTTNADGDLVTQSYPIHVITILDGAPGVSPTASVERVEGGALVTVTDASGTTTAMLNDAEVAEGSITDAMLASDGIKAQVRQLWANQLTKELTGEILTAADAYAAPPMAVTVDGKSVQFTTTGKNLLPNDRFCAGNYNRTAGYTFDPNASTSATLVDNGNGTFTMNVAAGWGGLSLYTASLPAGTYHLYFGFSGSTPRVALGYVDPDTMTYASQTENHTSSGTLDKSITLSATRIIVVSVQSSDGAAITITQPQVEAGSTTTAYEPYTGGKPSPSPDYPQEIMSVENPELTFAGKNLCGTITDSPNGKRFVGYRVDDPNRYPKLSCYLPAGTYMLSLDVRSVDNVVTYGNIRIWARDATDGQIYDLNVRSGEKSAQSYGGETIFMDKYYETIPTTFTHNTVAMNIGFPVSEIIFGLYQSGKYIEYDNLQIEVGSTATAYEPYDGTNVSLNLTQPLRSLPDGTHDTLSFAYLRPSTREGWAWYSRELVQRIAESDLGDLSWTLGSMTNDGTGRTLYSFSLSNTASKSIHSLRCSDYKYIEPVNPWERCTYGDIFLTTSPTLIVAADPSYDSNTAFKADSAGVKLQYALATPVTTTLDPIELPILPAPTCTVWADPSTGLQMEYVRDTNLAYAQLEAALADLATS